MTKQNRYLETLSQWNWWGLWFLVSRPLIEIFHGVMSKSLDWFVCLTPGIVFNLVILFRLDTPLFKFLKLSWLFPPKNSILYLGYALFFPFCGFLAWGLWQS